MNRLKHLFAALFLGSLLTTSAFGQASAINGQIVGTVSDATGAPIPGITVTATNVDTGYKQTSDTAENGGYRIPVLPLGRYELTAEGTAFAPYRQTGIELTAGSSATVNVTMQVRGVSAEVNVESAAPVVDPSRIDQGSNLNSNAVRNLPLVSRNPFNFILQQPNVSGRGNTEFGVPRKLNANGFNGRINYQLDGSNNVQSDRAGIRLMPISSTWIQEIQQVSNGFAPEFGNTVGTVYNSVTKSGTNDFHGEGGYLFRRTPMSARPALLAYNRPTPEVNVDSYFADAGGKLIKDKMFFFGSYEKVKRDLPAPVTVPAETLSQLGLPASYGNAIPFRQNVTFFLAKLDWQLNDSNRLSLRYNGHRNDSPYNSSSIGGLFLIDRTYNFVDRSHGGSAQLVTIFSPNIVNELRFQVPFRTQQQNRFEATGTGPAITIAGVANFGSSVDAGFLYDELTPEVNDGFTWTTGSHTLKFGGNVRSIRDTRVDPTFALYNFPSIAAYLAATGGSNLRGYTTFQQVVGNPSISFNSLFWGGYAQDFWKPLPNITVVYGLRYDVYQPPSANSSSLLPSSQKFTTDRNNFAPRAGISIGLGRTTLRASGGMFYDPFQTDTYRLALLRNGSPQYFTANLLPTNALAPSFPTVFTGIPTGVTAPTGDAYTVDPNFRTLYSVNGNVSVTQEITRDTAVTATYLFTRGNRLPIYRNINLIPSGQLLADGRPIFSTSRINPLFSGILSAESVGQSVYNGLNITLNRRFARGVQLFGSYTWSHSIDDAPEQNNIDSGNFLLSDPTNRRRDRGNSLTDRRHVFNGNAVFNPTFNLSNPLLGYIMNHNMLALTLVIQSGEVFNMGSNMVLNRDSSEAATFQRPLYIGRNTLRAPRTSELNARYSRIIPLFERLNLELIAEGTNLLNRTNVTGLNSTATVDALGNILVPPSLAWTGALDQRLLQVGFRVNW